MKFLQFFSFAVLATAAFVLTIVGMATLHWTTLGNNVLGTSTGQSHFGLRRYYNEINGESQGSHHISSDCSAQNQECSFFHAGNWGMGWGIAALILLALAVLVVGCLSCITLFHGMAGKGTAATLTFLSAMCIMIGAITYWTHLPGYVSTSDLSWSFVLYVIGGGLALLTSIALCITPTRHYVYANSAPMVAAPAVHTAPVYATNAAPMYATNAAPVAIVVQ